MICATKSLTREDGQGGGRVGGGRGRRCEPPRAARQPPSRGQAAAGKPVHSPVRSLQHVCSATPRPNLPLPHACRARAQLPHPNTPTYTHPPTHPPTRTAPLTHPHSVCVAHARTPPRHSPTGLGHALPAGTVNTLPPCRSSRYMPPSWLTSSSTQSSGPGGGPKAGAAAGGAAGARAGHGARRGAGGAAAGAEGGGLGRCQHVPVAWRAARLAAPPRQCAAEAPSPACLPASLPAPPLTCATARHHGPARVRHAGHLLLIELHQSRELLDLGGVRTTAAAAHACATAPAPARARATCAAAMQQHAACVRAWRARVRPCGRARSSSALGVPYARRAAAATTRKHGQQSTGAMGRSSAQAAPRAPLHYAAAQAACVAAASAAPALRLWCSTLGAHLGPAAWTGA